MATIPDSAQPQTAPSSRPLPWVAMLWFAGLLLLCYAPVLIRLVKHWDQDADMGHGFFVPLLAAYIAWLKRQELFAQAAVPNRWGLAVLGWGALQLMVATLGVELFLARTAFIISLIGCVLYMGGTRAVRVLAFPLFLLFFMVPIPAVIYYQITFPLQLLASQVAEVTLSLGGVPVFREGNILELPSQRLSVVEACSGIRSLLSLSFLSLVYGFFFEKKTWMRLVLVIATIPIAIVANASRVTLTGLLSEYNPELARGFFHSVEGWVIFMVALGILLVFHQVATGVYSKMRRAG